MPSNLAKYLTPLGVDADTITEIYGSITDARSETDDIRAGVISGAFFSAFPSPPHYDPVEIWLGMLMDC